MVSRDSLTKSEFPYSPFSFISTKFFSSSVCLATLSSLVKGIPKPRAGMPRPPVSSGMSQIPGISRTPCSSVHISSVIVERSLASPRRRAKLEGSPLGTFAIYTENPAFTISRTAYKSRYFSGSIRGSPNTRSNVSVSRIKTGAYTSVSESSFAFGPQGVTHANRPA